MSSGAFRVAEINASPEVRKMSRKRAICASLAKEDARRFNAGDASLSSQIAEDSERFPDLAKVIHSKSKNNALDHLRTASAWMRRASHVRIADLENICNILLGSNDNDAIEVATETRDHVELVELTDCDQAPNDVAKSPLSPAAASSVSASKFAAAMRENTGKPTNATLRSPSPNAASNVDAGRGSPLHNHSAVKGDCNRAGDRKFDGMEESVVSVGHSDTSHEGSVHTTLSKASGTRMKPSPNLRSASATKAIEHTTASVEYPAKDKSASSSQTPSRVQTLSQRTVLHDTEQGVHDRYSHSLSDLENARQSGGLRAEQFKRKRALLRAEYWMHLDKIRNNATPTVIGNPP